MTDEPFVEAQLSPAEAIKLVANETRIDILEALWSSDEPQPFTTLREAVGIQDSGQFNYHLDLLENRFVKKTDSGYDLTLAGQSVLGSIRSGEYTHSATVGPVEAGNCPHCRGDLEARYEEELVSVICTDCEETVGEFAVPPTLLAGFEPDELAGAFSRWVLTSFQRNQRGFCPECSGRVRAGIDRDPDDTGSSMTARYTCEVCGSTVTGPLGVAVLDHPVVVEFHADHGIDLRRDLLWELPWLIETTPKVVADNPLRVRLEAKLGNDRLSIVVDDDLDVVSIERSPCPGSQGSRTK
jgi:hypothetical protein